MWKKLKYYLQEHKGIIIATLILSILIIFLLNYKNINVENIEKISYNEFIEYVKEGKVDTIYYNKNNEWMTITIYNHITENMTREELDLYTGYTNNDKKLVQYPAYDTFRKDMLKYDINLVVEQNTGILDILSSLLSILFPLLWITLIIRLVMTQTGDIKKQDILQTSEVKFDDIIGHEEIIDDIKFITELIKNPIIGEDVGAKVPKGILLSGDPGCGKTLIAKAIAGEAGIPFLYQNASSFIDRFVGMGAKHVRDLFKLAKQNTPCIIFIDEIDAIGGNRDNNRGTSENDQTINALLQEMDGFNGRDGIFVIAATNRPDILDKALVRAGRFDRQIIVSPPRNWEVRQELFKHYLSKFAISDDINIENLSKQVTGFTGADIAMVCNEASIIAVMNNKAFIDNDCIEEAIDKKIFKGNRSKREHYLDDKKIVAYHEAGHAVMSYLLDEPIARASIQSTVSGIGGAVFNEDKNSLFQTNEDFENRVLICYAGRASEQIKFKKVTTGASNDITQATNIMMHYIERFGFDKDFGLLDISVLSKEHLINGKEITNKLSEMSKELYNKCLNTLKDNYNLVELLATDLLKNETLTGEEIKNLFNNV